MTDKIDLDLKIKYLEQALTKEQEKVKKLQKEFKYYKNIFNLESKELNRIRSGLTK